MPTSEEREANSIATNWLLWYFWCCVKHDCLAARSILEICEYNYSDNLNLYNCRLLTLHDAATDKSELIIISIFHTILCPAFHYKWRSKQRAFLSRTANIWRQGSLVVFQSAQWHSLTITFKIPSDDEIWHFWSCSQTMVTFFLKESFFKT